VRGTHHKERARRRFPDIAAAEALVRDATKCEQLKILVVGDCPVSEIAARTGISVSILEAWESIFFDVRAARDASDWVFRWVMVPLLQQGNGRLAAKLKFAYAGGPLAAKALLDAEARVPLKQGVRLFDQKLLLQVKFEEALQYPLNSNRDALNFIKMHADLMYQEKRLQLQERKLAQRSDEALAKQKLAERRLEVSAQRLAERAARRAHGEAERSRQGAAAGL
jgi:hypothetical protein